MSRVISRAALGVALAAVAAVGLAACDEGGSSADADALQLAVAINYLDSAGLHGIDDEINKDQKVPTTAKTAVQKAATVVKVADWPTKDLRDAAKELGDTLVDLAEALDAEQPDLKVAGELAKKAHDLEHDLSHDVWAHLQQEAGVSEPHGDDHD